jgi:hypothetical protein
MEYDHEGEDDDQYDQRDKAGLPDIQHNDLPLNPHFNFQNFRWLLNAYGTLHNDAIIKNI